jgi:hypothetical protein
MYIIIIIIIIYFIVIIIEFMKICGAVLSIILAISGYDEDCACFSDNLQHSYIANRRI